MSEQPRRIDLDEAERERRLGHSPEDNPGVDDLYERELADRTWEASPRQHLAVRELTRARGGLGRSPYEQPNAPEPPPSPRPGEAVSYRGEAGDERARHGTVEAVLDDDSGAVVVRLDGGGCQVVSADALERSAW